MTNRTRTLASFFSVAMAAMLLGAVVTTQIRPEAAQARSLDPAQTSSAANRASEAIAVGLNTFRDIARDKTPGVVNINTKKTVRRSPHSRDPFRDFFGDDFMERFFGPRGEQQTQRSLGSGFVVDKDGYVLTNRHVVEGADEVSVTVVDGKTYEAKVVGKDARTDVALLKIDPKAPLTVLSMGDSDRLEVGEWVMAIGNPFGLGNSVTVGVVSFKGRDLPLGVPNTSVDMIQTDAAINPGNSGGPLLNSAGEVVGINTMIFTSGAAQSAGVGFAVPINVAKQILPQLREKGTVVRGWLGVSVGALSEDLAKTYGLGDAQGAVVNEVTKDSPAEKAGLKPEDVILQVNDHLVKDSSDLSRFIAGLQPSTTVRLKLQRDGKQIETKVVLGTFPEQSAKASDDESEGQAQLGMTLRNLTPDVAERLELPPNTRGVLVWDVESGSEAEDAGLRRGDLIVTVNGAAVKDVDDLQAEVEKAKSDGVARLRVRRGSGYFIVALRLH